MARAAHEVGIIADTHGQLRPQAVAALAGVEHIIHAGDIGAQEVLQGLCAIAPLTAIRGNNDRFSWARSLPRTAEVRIGEARLYVLHDLHELAVDPGTDGFAAVISGHSHHPSVVERNGVLFVNPGSAGPRRFTLPVSVARLQIRATRVQAQVVMLSV